jgi:hypothetical protein
MLCTGMRRVIILIVLLLIVGCEHGRPSFLARVREDCAAGDQWACALIESLAKNQNLQ